MVEFVCPICLEGDNGEPTRLHPCGVHRYHLRCLVSHFRDDKRCALCRRTGPATASEPGITPAVTYRHVTASNWECTYCKNNLIQNHSCYEINACHHLLHVFCFNHLLMMYGITSTGQVFCQQCGDYK